ncbi:putative ABC transporter ATP-binding protein YbhF [compost metagenome]
MHNERSGNHKITKKFDDIIAVDDISFSVRPGEIFGSLGPNGAGKSTVNHMISSLLSMISGQITLLGKDITKQGKFAKANIGLVPQELAIYEDMSTNENAAFFAGLYGLRGHVDFGNGANKHFQWQCFPSRYSCFNPRREL